MLSPYFIKALQPSMIVQTYILNNPDRGFYLKTNIRTCISPPVQQGDGTNKHFIIFDMDRVRRFDEINLFKLIHVKLNDEIIIIYNDHQYYLHGALQNYVIMKPHIKKCIFEGLIIRVPALDLTFMNIEKILKFIDLIDEYFGASKEDNDSNKSVEIPIKKLGAFTFYQENLKLIKMFFEQNTPGNKLKPIKGINLLQKAENYMDENWMLIAGITKTEEGAFEFLPKEIMCYIGSLKHAQSSSNNILACLEISETELSGQTIYFPYDDAGG